MLKFKLGCYKDERSSSSLTEFEPLPDGLESDVLDLDRDTTMIFLDKSLLQNFQKVGCRCICLS